MSTNVNFNSITLGDDGIVLGLRGNRKRKISFSELDKIYMKVYKMKPIYELAFIVLPFIFVLFAVQYIMLEKVMFLALFTVAPVFIKTYGYKRNGLTVRLKDGTILRKNVSVKFKTENVAMVNAVKRACMNYSVKTKQLDSLDFHHNKAS